MKLMSLVVVVAAAAFTHAGIARAQSVAAPAEVPLIARSELFGNPDRGNAQLSPDGKYIAWLASEKGVLNVWVAPVGDLGAAKAVTTDTNRGIRQYFWNYASSHIVFLQDEGGDENWRMYSIELATGLRKDLTPFDSITGPDGKPLVIGGRTLRPAARVILASASSPDEIAIGINNRNPQLHDIYRCNVRTGELKLIIQNEGYVSFVLDNSLKVRFATKYTSDARMQLFKASDNGAFTLYSTVNAEDTLTTGPLGFNRAGDTLYMLDSRGRDTSALRAINFAQGKDTLLAEDSRADVGGVSTHPVELTPDAASIEYERLEWHVLNPKVKADFDYLQALEPGDMELRTRTLDDRLWLVSYSLSDGPSKYFLYSRANDGTTGKATFLFSTRPSLDKLPLAKMHSRVIAARDDRKLVSYLTLPRWLDEDGDGVPSQPVPMVLLVHGGPWARDSWGFEPHHQWLSNRGYAVLSVNFRSSTGFGKSFVNAGNGQWAGEMHDDLLAAVTWAVKNKIADPAKVGIMGGSYGGYATLVGLTFTPETFACGVDIVGPSNLVTLMQNIPPYWAPFLPVLTQRVGDPRTEAGRKGLESKSPLFHVAKIRRPLLIGQGANDPRVKQSESDQIVAAMQTKNIPVTYVLFPDEGHGFAKPDNSMAFYAIAEAFLKEHLGGRAEPIADAVSKSSAQIKAGKVPGEQ